MKTLFLTLLLFSHPSMAETLKGTITDINNDRRIEVYCGDEACSTIRIAFFQNGKNAFERKWTAAELDQRANQKLKRTSRCGNCDSIYTPYYLTQEAIESAREQWTRGYHGKAIFGYLLVSLTSIVDSAGLIITPATYYGGTWRPEKHPKRTAQRLASLLEQDQFELRLKEKQFNRIAKGL